MLRRGRAFQQDYQVVSFSTVGKRHLEKTGKIVLPSSALEVLTRLQVDYPMLFSLKSDVGILHAGIQEFTAEEGNCVMPGWMMDQLGVIDGDIISVRSAFLQKGSYIKLQPRTEDFLNLHNPLVVLEIVLRDFSALTLDQDLVVSYQDSQFYFKVKEIKPLDANSKAISIVEADIHLDFDEPMISKPKAPPPMEDVAHVALPEPTVLPDGTLDYGRRRRPRKLKAKTDSDKEKEPEFVVFSGKGQSLREPRASRPGAAAAAAAHVSAPTPAPTPATPVAAPAEPKPFTPFGGHARSLKD